MSLRDAINHYLTLRRGLGFKLLQVGRWLNSYASFMEEQSLNYVTIESALKWATLPTNVSSQYVAQRLDAVRGFARYWVASDPRTQIPATDLLPRCKMRVKPYLYSEADIVQLIRAATTLRSNDSLDNQTYSVLIALLAVTGLRSSEALRLTDHQVDLQQGVLRICHTKFDKSRLVPIHKSTQQALLNYKQRRNQTFNRRSFDRFFVTAKGAPLFAKRVRQIFYNLTCQIGLRNPGDRTGPLLHHLRYPNLNKIQTFFKDT